MAALFGTLGITAVVAGGLLAAFSARRPTRLKAWVSAYLVLVVGIIQFGLAVGWQRLGGHDAQAALVAFGLYNAGNAAVVAGTSLCRRLPVLVKAGGGALGLAMALLAWTARGVAPSWTLAWFLALVLVVVASAPAGLVLSARRSQPVA